MTVLASFLTLATLMTAASPRISVTRETSYTGRGNNTEVLLELTIGTDTPCRLDGIDIELSAETGDVTRVCLLHSGRTLCSRKVTGGKAAFHLTPCTQVMHTSTLQICADISSSAVEGHKVGCDITSVVMDGQVIKPFIPEPGKREIILCRKCLFAPGDYGSKAWRIPAILQLEDGTLLVVNDKRNCSENDLPGEIDITARRSKDRGKTWDEPTYVVKSHGFMTGHGDPALAQLPDGTVICLFCGAETFSRSSTANPQRSFFALSHDSGLTWDEPVEITSSIWGSDSSFPQTASRTSNFFSSGNALVVNNGPYKGRLLVAGVLMDKDSCVLVNHAIYSDDCAKTWHASSIACNHGDEAKMVDLNDGSILMSIRASGDRLWTISNDGGQTWGPLGQWPDMHVTNCNGDLIRYDNGLLLHSTPYSMSRENVSVLLSRDEGRTWTFGKTILQGPSQYSSLTVLKDGTIGAYIEKNTWGTELWYENFSLDWLLAKDIESEMEETAMTGIRLWEGGPIWAERNLGATAPEASGRFFAWGETAPKNVFGWGSYAFGHSEQGMKQYADSTLSSGDDAATKLLGEGWSIPTADDFKELRDRCTWTWISTQDRSGFEIKGECGSIFLPAAGYKSGNMLKYPRDCGYYWTTNRSESSAAQAMEYFFNSQYPGDCFGRGRDCGHVIRPIKK